VAPWFRDKTVDPDEGRLESLSTDIAWQLWQHEAPWTLVYPETLRARPPATHVHRALGRTCPDRPISAARGIDIGDEARIPLTPRRVPRDDPPIAPRQGVGAPSWRGFAAANPRHSAVTPQRRLRRW